tara:strand:+ start:93 stop:323 length:231 start_codon:yes stop_codon:yes gene_type:complete
MGLPRLSGHWHVWTIRRSTWGDQNSWSGEQLRVDQQWADAVREAGLGELLDDPEKMDAWLAAHAPDEEPSSENEKG